MDTITFIDTEIEPGSGKILDLGGIKNDGGTFHSGSTTAFVEFLKGTRFVCGHNILNHDVKYIRHLLEQTNIHADNIIDTLYLSPLLFPSGGAPTTRRSHPGILAPSFYLRP